MFQVKNKLITYKLYLRKQHCTLLTNQDSPNIIRCALTIAEGKIKVWPQVVYHGKTDSGPGVEMSVKTAR